MSRPARTAGLVAEGICYTYPNGTHVVDDWDAQFPAGAVTAVTGPSGSGKSTVLYILGLMHRQTRGELFVDGQSTAALADSARARLRAHRFGFVFQDAALDPSRTVIDNVVEAALYRRESRARAVARATDLLDDLGVGLRASHRPGQISGGQAQRIALCRALLWSPAFVMADEPTGNLDPTTRDLVVEVLRERARLGACVVVATHDPGVVGACDQQVALGAPL
ncbi:ABC transporter ATP-binding protein [Cellulomonas sp. SLBN-39]|uniref:ABC transporter ATP-binding protein n=1 Tax=Cellulomonas sp. SLBN-39 TaxID=2768446 RepID=UPI00114E293A|nr:ABC transporter ATP-binding protein [Cellulomonas sp. SLBN-39]TQL02156.1 putative ABC transport system ATP-binding protein/lipoprotein-releasing system ATP-binding protein [Cellulomonas sp. SLBN-39]